MANAFVEFLSSPKVEKVDSNNNVRPALPISETINAIAALITTVERQQAEIKEQQADIRSLQAKYSKLQLEISDLKTARWQDSRGLV